MNIYNTVMHNIVNHCATCSTSTINNLNSNYYKNDNLKDEFIITLRIIHSLITYVSPVVFIRHQPENRQKF